MKALCRTDGDGRRRWHSIWDCGRAGVGPFYNDGPSCWLDPFDPSRDWSSYDRVIDSDDLASIREEIKEYGNRHIRDFLRQSGLAVEISSQRFNRCNEFNNPVDVQFDHGCLAVGVRVRYESPLLGLSWSSEFS